MALKPWHDVVKPREDIASGKPLDAAEFAVHLDHVRDGRAVSVYANPAEFFERTFLTKGLTDLSVQMLKRLSGEKTATSAVFNMATQFGGGKTHALTLLYHLARGGDSAKSWKGVSRLLQVAGVATPPEAATAVFVGTEFDGLSGRGGNDGTPKRKTPWGEIAFQLGGEKAFAEVAKHDEEGIPPGGETIRKVIPADRPCLILMDELIHYISTYRKSGMGTQLYNFLQNLSEESRAQDRVVLAVSVPASELEMTAEDTADYTRLKKLLDRLGKPVVMAAEAETSEIIRRRLFEWGGLPEDGKKTAEAYAAWVLDHRKQIPEWFSADHAREEFEAKYPFHPSLISVFERKWQSVDRFQRTRGVLRMLAMWVSKAYEENYKKLHRDPLIGVGTAPLDDPGFREAVFEQLGEERLKVAVETDICGSKTAHAVVLDAEASDEIKKKRLHRKVATAIFFESNGGQKSGFATIPEVRLAVSEPGLDIGNVESVVEALAPPSGCCYYLDNQKNRYWFGVEANPNKVLADRMANIDPEGPQVRDVVRAEIQKNIVKEQGVELRYFPEDSSQIPNSPVVTLVVLPPNRCRQDPSTYGFIEKCIKEHGQSARVFKNALIFVVPEDATAMRDEARKVLAWEDIAVEADALGFKGPKKEQLEINVRTAKKQLRDAVWKAYKQLAYLDKDGSVTMLDLGPLHWSQTEALAKIYLTELRRKDVVTDTLTSRQLAKNWPGGTEEWSTKGVRDAIFASPLFHKLLRSDSLLNTIIDGVESRTFAYAAKSNGGYDPFHFGDSLMIGSVEIADDVFLVKKDAAVAYEKALETGKELEEGPEKKPEEDYGEEEGGDGEPGDGEQEQETGGGRTDFTKIRWNGEIPWQKWMTFYNQVVSKYSAGGRLKLSVSVEIKPPGGVSKHQVDEMKSALANLKLPDDVDTE